MISKEADSVDSWSLLSASLLLLYLSHRAGENATVFMASSVSLLMNSHCVRYNDLFVLLQELPIKGR